MADETPADADVPLSDPNAGFDASSIVTGFTDLIAQLEATIAQNTTVIDALKNEVAEVKKFALAVVAEKNALVAQIQVLTASLSPKLQSLVDTVKSYLPGH